MAHDIGSQLSGLCFLSVFIWSANSMDSHSLIDKPRLSAFVLLLLSGAGAYAASFYSKRLPGADGRFDSEAILKASGSLLPQKPRRYYVPCVVVLIVLRLEVLHSIEYDFQCTIQGVEAFLPLLLVAYGYFFNRKAPPPVPSDEPEEMWGNPWEDFKTWFRESQVLLLFSAFVFSYGVFLAADFAPKSTYFCSSVLDPTRWVVFLQGVGVAVDAAILVLLWRVLSWARTTKNRLRTLSEILISASFGVALVWILSRPFQQRPIANTKAFRGLNSLYLFDVVSYGIICSVLAVSAVLWISESGTVLPASVVTFVNGFWMAVHNVALIGTYKQTSTWQPVLVLAIISGAFWSLIYMYGIRSILVIRRTALMSLLTLTLFCSVLFAFFCPKSISLHPINELIYSGRIDHDRWLRHAKVSVTLKLAVSEYKDRHHGRDPPVGFDKWFQYARERHSVMIDNFDQIEKDILPFWGMKPQRIRERLEIVKQLPNVGIIEVASGKASHNQPEDPDQRIVLDEVVSMVSNFVGDLPDMIFAINLQERPRILVPWEDIHQLTETATKSGFSILPSLGKRHSGITSRQAATEVNTRPYISPETWRHLEALACPPGSASRVGVNWNVRDFCTSCADPHSEGQVLRNWEKALDPCHQPDLYHLHDFHTMPHRYELFQDLLPLFSRSKTDSFNDILIPLVDLHHPSNEPEDTKALTNKENQLFWQDEPISGPLTHQTIHGSHRHRLVHLANNASAFDRTTMLLGVGVNKVDYFVCDTTSTPDASSHLPLALSFTSPEHGCSDETCRLVAQEFGFQPRAEPLDYRYILLLDGPDGPSPALLPTLRSNSVPFLSTIFKEWYTERLMPWTHFVPIDIRYQGLHSTLSYFVGMRGRAKTSGLEQKVSEQIDDARWIAEEGRKWSEKALRREDMEIYLFRLLLEWGRVMSEEREDMGFVFEEGK